VVKSASLDTFSRVHVPDGVLGNLEIAGMLLTRPSLLSQLLIPNAHVPNLSILAMLYTVNWNMALPNLQSELLTDDMNFSAVLYSFGSI
jgi:hypothetical protein